MLLPHMTYSEPSKVTFTNPILADSDHSIGLPTYSEPTHLPETVKSRINKNLKIMRTKMQNESILSPTKQLFIVRMLNGLGIRWQMVERQHGRAP